MRARNKLCIPTSRCLLFGGTPWAVTLRVALSQSLLSGSAPTMTAQPLWGPPRLAPQFRQFVDICMTRVSQLRWIIVTQTALRSILGKIVINDARQLIPSLRHVLLLTHAQLSKRARARGLHSVLCHPPFLTHSFIIYNKSGGRRAVTLRVALSQSLLSGSAPTMTAQPLWGPPRLAPQFRQFVDICMTRVSQLRWIIVTQTALRDADGLVDVLERRRTLFPVQISFICLLNLTFYEQLTFWLRITHVKANF